MKKSVTRWEKYLTEEIGIEFKACLYFFSILFFYSVYRVACGSLEAGIIHMTEMIFLTYAMGYVQVYFLSNFDEGDKLGIREWLYLTGCSLVYGAVSYLGNWFDKNLWVSLGYVLFMMFTYVCAVWVYKMKRNIDERILNEDLKAFQERRNIADESDRN